MFFLKLAKDWENGNVQDILQEFDWYFLPVLNVDGYIYTWTTVREGLFQLHANKTRPFLLTQGVCVSVMEVQIVIFICTFEVGSQEYRCLTEYYSLLMKAHVVVTEDF